MVIDKVDYLFDLASFDKIVCFVVGSEDLYDQVQNNISYIMMLQLAE